MPRVSASHSSYPRVSLTPSTMQEESQYPFACRPQYPKGASRWRASGSLTW